MYLFNQENANEFTNSKWFVNSLKTDLETTLDLIKTINLPKQEEDNLFKQVSQLLFNVEHKINIFIVLKAKFDDERLHVQHFCFTNTMQLKAFIDNLKTTLDSNPYIFEYKKAFKDLYCLYLEEISKHLKSISLAPNNPGIYLLIGDETSNSIFMQASMPQIYLQFKSYILGLSNNAMKLLLENHTYILDHPFSSNETDDIFFHIADKCSTQDVCLYTKALQLRANKYHLSSEIFNWCINNFSYWDCRNILHLAYIKTNLKLDDLQSLFENGYQDIVYNYAICCL